MSATVPAPPRRTRRAGPWVWLPLCLFALSCVGGTRLDDDRLIQDLESPHWQIRASAAEELGRRKVERAAAALGAALGDGSSEVRGAAAMSLGRLGAQSELDKIRGLLADEEDRQVEVLALYALADLAAGEQGDSLREDVALVEEKLDDDSRRVKRAAARVLRILAGRSEADLETDEAATRSKPEAEQKRWSFDRIEDRITLAQDGECTLSRTVVVRARQTNPLGRIVLFLPPSFPQIDRVVDAGGSPLTAQSRRKGDQPQVWFAIPPLAQDQTAAFTVEARSRRLVFAGDRGEALLVHSPAPVDAPVAALLVELTVPARGARAIEPADLRLQTGAQDEVARLERSGLTSRELDKVVLRVGIPASALRPPRPFGRFYSTGLDFTLAAAVVLAALAALAACIFWLRRTLGASSQRAILAAVLTTGAILFLTPILVEDNFTYLASARSAVFDGDLDQVNEFSEMNQTQAFDPDHRAPLDPMFVWLSRTPLLAAAHGLTLGIDAFAPAHAPNGFSFPYLFLVAVGDFLAVLFGCLACFSLVERRIGPQYALFAVLAVFAGTNLHLFAYGWTASSFQPSFFLFAVFLDLWDRTREHRSGPAWLGAGALLGLLGATRTLNLGFVVLPLLDWSTSAFEQHNEHGRRGLTRHVGHGALLAVGFLLAYAPQLVLHRLVDGVWVLDVYGVGTGRFGGLMDHLSGLLFRHSPNRYDGLLATMPILALAFAGLVPLLRTDRRWGTLLATTLSLQILAIGAYEIYWGYFRYGTPYLAPSSPIICLALGSLLKVVHERWPRRGAAVLAALAVPMVARTIWCTVRQLGSNMTGDPTSGGGTLEVLHAMLIPVRKLDVNVMLNSTEFGCLLRETVGALRAHDAGQLLSAMLWAALLVALTCVAFGAVSRLGRWASRVPPRTLRIVAVSALIATWIAGMGWVVSLGTRTNLDYRLRSEYDWAPKREIGVIRIAPGATHSVPMDLEFPEAMSVVTFLEDAVDVRQGQIVATIRIDGPDERASFDLRAGVDTADFAIDRPESKAARAHTAPLNKASMTWRVGDDSSHFYTARAYRAEFKLPPLERKFTIHVTSKLERGTLAVTVVNVVEQKLPRDLARRRWLAERW